MIDPEYLDITVPPSTEYIHPTSPSHTVIGYIISGSGYFCKEKNPFGYKVEGRNWFDIQREPLLNSETVVLFEDGEQLEVATESDAVRFLLISGKPIGEPIAWYGPIVMNSQEELQTAFEEYRNGTFIK